MSELKPCPFCGGDAERFDDHDTGSFNFGMSCITCKQCGASSAMHGDRKENLYSSWNTRPTPAPSAEVREALEPFHKAIRACEGEQWPFEDWAKKAGYDIEDQHPLHYIFMNEKTNAARMGWKAALAYAEKNFAAVLSPETGSGREEVGK